MTYKSNLRVFVSSCLRGNLVPLPIFVSILVLLSVSTTTSAQTKNITSRQQIWVAYFNQTRFSKNFGGWLDLQYRQTGDFINRPFQFLFRPAVTWYATDALRVNVGYAYVHHFPHDGGQSSQPEHRAWQQLWYRTNQPHMQMLQWLRLEERFIRKVENDEWVEGYTRRYRIRYNASMAFPLKGEKIAAGVPFIMVSDEVFFNLGKSVVYNTFDQNRFFAGLGYSISDHMNVQFGYLNVFQQQATGSSYTVSHALRLAVFHNLDLRE